MIQQYTITKYNKDSYPRIFSKLKSGVFSKATNIYQVERMRGNSNERIGRYKTLAAAKKAIKSNASKMKRTSGINIGLIVQGKGIKKI